LQQQLLLQLQQLLLQLQQLLLLRAHPLLQRRLGRAPLPQRACAAGSVFAPLFLYQ
jgi:hypothetical protein